MKWSILGILLVCTVCLLFFPVNLRPEIGFRPLWKVDVGDSELSELPNSFRAAGIPFDLDRLFGYVSLDGDLLLSEEKGFGLAIDSKRYIGFESVSRSLAVHNSIGGLIESFEISGYPMLLDERLLILSSNRSEIAELTGGEKPSWKKEYTTIITDIDARGGLIALGLLDSRVQVLDLEGDLVLDLDLKGSRINTIYGCSLSEDTTKVAVIHGIDPQYVSVVDIEAVEVANFRLDAEFRTTRYVRFMNSDQYLLIEDDGLLIIFDLEKNTEYKVPVTGSFADAGSMESDNLIWIMTGDEEGYEFLVLDPPLRVLFKMPIIAGVKAFPAGERVMLGIEGNLCMVQKEHR